MYYLIFGAGNYGKKALEEYGKEAVCGFIDNSVDRQGQLLDGILIYSLEDAVRKWPEAKIVIATLYSASIILQLRDIGITNYELYVENDYGYYDTYDLVVNPYEVVDEATTESEWIDSKRNEYMRQAVNDEVEVIHSELRLFNHIEVETINRCNGSCSFCPVNHNDDPREKAIMSEDLFQSIVKQLEEINYSGRFTTFSNNEPLLDDRIIDFNKYARKHLPNARIHMFTNGTLLTIDKFKELVEVLDELIIDNYQQELKLIKPCKEIVEYCESHPELKKKVTIVLRKPQEILTSRGGTAPNRKELVEYNDDRCVLPFKQIIVRPTGKISLCCNDAIGKYTLGDLNKETLLDIWYGPRFEMIRKSLYEGRKNWGNCRFCDTFNIG